MHFMKAFLSFSSAKSSLATGPSKPANQVAQNVLAHGQSQAKTQPANSNLASSQPQEMPEVRSVLQNSNLSNLYILWRARGAGSP